MKKLLTSLSIICGFFFLFLALHFGLNYFFNNVHTVIPGKIYRSAQLNQSELAKYAQKFQLKSIINLRGVWEKEGWFQVEKKFTTKEQLHYYTIHFSAYELPPKRNLKTLIKILQIAPKPLMFHCEGGADRTGMASAISLILFDKDATISQIKNQVSWHFNVISKSTVGYQILRNYFSWLKFNHYKSSAERFLEWVNSPEPMKVYHGWFLNL